MGLKRKIIIIGLCVVMSLTAAVSTIVYLVTKDNGTEPDVSEDTGIEIFVNDNIKEKIEDIFTTEGVGNEQFYNEETRNESTPFVIYVQADPETGEEKTYATLFVNHKDQETIGEGENQETIDLLHTMALSIELSQETIDILNKPGTQEEIINAIKKDLDGKAKEDITYIDNFAGIELDDEENYLLTSGIRNSLLAQSQTFVGYTEAADVTLLSTYRDEKNDTYNVFGMISEGMNSQYFMFNKKITNEKEYREAREALKDLVKGGKLEDVGYVITSQADLDNEILVFQIDDKVYTYKAGMLIPMWTAPVEPNPEVAQ